jgi:hypothetical protein
MDDFERDQFERDQFERELKQAFQRRPAPPSLKRKLMEQRGRQHTGRLRFRAVMWQRLAASVLLVAALGGGLAWRNREEQRKGEAAREQVLTALRITCHALDRVKIQLAEHDRGTQ